MGKGKEAEWSGPEPPGPRLAAAGPWLALPSWLQAPYSLMTCGWLTCVRRLNSDSRSRSSLAEAFSEMHVNTAGCKAVPSVSPFCSPAGSQHPQRGGGGGGLHRPIIPFRDILPRFRRGLQGSHCLELLSARGRVNSSLMCLRGVRTREAHFHTSGSFHGKPPRAGLYAQMALFPCKHHLSRTVVHRDPLVNPSGKVKGLPVVPKHLLTKCSTVAGEALQKGEDRQTSQKSSSHAEHACPKGGQSMLGSHQKLGCGGILRQKLWLHSSPGLVVPQPSAQLCHLLWVQTCLEMRRQLGDGALGLSGPHVGDPGPVSLCPLGPGISWARGDPSLRAWASIQKHSARHGPPTAEPKCASADCPLHGRWALSRSTWARAWLGPVSAEKLQ